MTLIIYWYNKCQLLEIRQKDINQMVSYKSEMKEIIGKLIVKNPKIFNSFQNLTKNILGSLNQDATTIMTDTECALSSAAVLMLTKIENGELAFPDDVNDKEAFIMSVLQNHVKFYLLKRYARRTGRKSLKEYMEEVNEEKESGQRVNRHRGPRFESMLSIDDYAVQGACITYDEYSKETEDIIKIIAEKDIPTSAVQILSYRLEGYTFKEIAEILGDGATQDSVRVSFARAMKKAGIDISAFKIYTREQLNAEI